jgi:hypothetical protein
MLIRAPVAEKLTSATRSVAMGAWHAATQERATRAFFSAALPAQREAVQAAETMAATFAENPKLRGMTIVVTDDDGKTICKVTVPSQH